jgi:hypothetical protein
VRQLAQLEPLLRDTLRADPTLEKFGILRFANATVHEVKPEEDERLRELLHGGELIPWTHVHRAELRSDRRRHRHIGIDDRS